MKEKEKLVEEDIELTDDQLANVTGGFQREFNPDFKAIQDKIGVGKTCPNCNSRKITTTFRTRSVATCECQDCGFVWESRPY